MVGIFFLIFVFLPFGQLAKLPLGVVGVSVYLHDFLLLILWLWLIVFKRDQVFKDKLFKRGLLFVIVAFLSWLVAYFSYGKASLFNLGYLVRVVLLSGVYFVLPFFDKSKDQILKLVRLSIFWLILFGWVQYLFFPDLTMLKYLGWDDHYFRMTGSLLDPNFFGLMVVLGFGLELWQGKSFLKKMLYLISLGLTYSRSSWLSFVLMVVCWGVNLLFSKTALKSFGQRVKQNLKKGFKAAGVFVWLSLALVVFFLLPRPEGEGGDLARTASVISRYRSWDQAVEIFTERPLLGVGFNNYRLAQKDKGYLSQADWQTNHAGAGADNSYLFVLATTGVLGLIAFGYFLSSLSPWWLMAPIMVHSLLNNSWFYPWVLVFVFAVSGLDKLQKKDNL